jgi:hypothetical protein
MREVTISNCTLKNSCFCLLLTLSLAVAEDNVHVHGCTCCDRDDQTPLLLLCYCKRVFTEGTHLFGQSEPVANNLTKKVANNLTKRRQAIVLHTNGTFTLMLMLTLSFACECVWWTQ